MIKGLTHVAVRVRDIEESIRFYRDTLGLPEQFRLTSDQGGIRLVYIRVGQRQYIELFPGAEGPHQMVKTAAPVHICLEVDDIRATYQELSARGLEPTREPALGADRSWQFWAKDPDGNQIEFHQFTPESMQLQGSP